MRKILLFLAIVIFLSGCTLPFIGEPQNPSPEPIIINLDSELRDVKSNDTTILYLILDNLDKDEEYEVEATIINPGFFSVLSSPNKIKISGLDKKVMEWDLQAQSVPKETNTEVSVEIKISKRFEFDLPIYFANPLYLREMEQLGKPIPRKPKSYSFSDNLIYVNAELNKQPPIDSGVVYVNFKLNPKNGFIESFDLMASSGKCELDSHKKVASCEFKVSNVEKIEERRFKIIVDYTIKMTKSLDFTILPTPAVYPLPAEAEISLMQQYCFLNFSDLSNICEFKLNPIKFCDGEYKKDCIKDIERMGEIEDNLGGKAFATLDTKKGYLKIWNINKSQLDAITYPSIWINYTYLDIQGKEKESRENLIPIIVLYENEKVEKQALKFENETFFLNNSFFSLYSVNEDLRVKSMCGNSKELSVNINYHNETGDVMIWYIKDSDYYRIDYYEFKKFKETIAKEKNPKDLIGKKYIGFIGAIEVLNASENNLKIKAMSSSSSASFSLSFNTHSEKCGYIVAYEKRDNKKVVTIAKLKE